MRLDGRRVVVMGLARSGQKAALLARSRGADVVGLDLRSDVPPIPGVCLELGPHRRSTLLGADLIVVSPGIPASQPDITAAMARGVPAVSELAFAASFLDLPILAVTGTNGKSTVTHFTGALLAHVGLRPFVGGNIGRPLSDVVLGIQSGERPDCLVVEVSSYQLELPGTFHPLAAVVLNLSPDHLNRHGDLDGYAAAKSRIFAQMTPGDLAILPHGDLRMAQSADGVGEGTRAWIGAFPGVRCDGKRAEIQIPGVHATIDVSTLPVPGAHNRDNAAVAAMLALAVGADPVRVQRGIASLKALPHRMEIVAERAGVTWINDSKATNIGAARVGIGGLARSAVVLLGGRSKSAGFGKLATDLQRHRAVVTFGEAGPAIADELKRCGVQVTRATSLALAVEAAVHLAKSGDAILLSPGCASFDAFDDFEHRGQVFAELAREVVA